MATYQTKLFDGFSVQTAKAPVETRALANEVTVGEDFKERIGEGEVIYALLYPNFAINLYGNIMDTNLVVPLSHNRTRIIYDYYVERRFLSSLDDAHRKDFLEKSIAASSKVQEEDTKVCENLQIGLESMGYDKGRYAPAVELGTHHFHQFVARGISSPSPS